ncbi:MAG: sugar transferase [Kiritimatiellae bacterium]|nr:sugar transferase [Kiritimatiellia bacterium]
MVKRIFDIALVVLTIEYWLPLMVVVAIAIILFDGGPVFFLQERAGRNGKPFYVFKFKTMISNREGATVATPLGKWLRKLSLDEIPQLVNVLLGHMSLVGPRPLPVKYLPRYSRFEARRHEVRPGITGWAQVHGRNAITWQEKFAYDVEYVDKHNLLMDIKILLMTIPAAFQGGGEMEEFRGS